MTFQTVAESRFCSGLLALLQSGGDFLNRSPVGFKDVYGVRLIELGNEYFDTYLQTAG